MGLTFRSVAGLTGLSTGQVHRGITDPAAANGQHVRQIKRVLTDEARIRRSSDPALLRHVIEEAVPFLRKKLRA